MDQEHELDVGIAIERRRNLVDRGGGAVAAVDPGIRPLDMLQDLGRPLAVIAIDQHQGLAAAAGREAAKCRLDGEGPGPLHQHALRLRPGMGEAFELVADGTDDVAELGIARPPVGEHGKLDRARRGERAGRQEIGHVLLALGALIGRSHRAEAERHGVDPRIRCRRPHGYDRNATGSNPIGGRAGEPL